MANLTFSQKILAQLFIQCVIQFDVQQSLKECERRLRAHYPKVELTFRSMFANDSVARYRTLEADSDTITFRFAKGVYKSIGPSFTAVITRHHSTISRVKFTSQSWSYGLNTLAVIPVAVFLFFASLQFPGGYLLTFGAPLIALFNVVYVRHLIATEQVRRLDEFRTVLDGAFNA